MSEVVLDASALLAVFNGERGSDRVIEALPESVISAVNLAEVATKLQERGMPDDRIRANIEALELTVIPLEMGLAIDTGLLRAATRSAPARPIPQVRSSAAASRCGSTRSTTPRSPGSRSTTSTRGSCAGSVRGR